MKKIIAFWICLMLCGGYASARGEVIVSIGDSLARGYGLDDPARERYGARLAELSGGSEINLGVDGLRADELLTLIETEFADPLGGADIVLVSIGANHVLGDMLYIWHGGNLDDALADIDGEMISFGETLDGIAAALRSAAPNARIVYLCFFNPWATCEDDTVRASGEAMVSKLNAVIRDKAESADALAFDPSEAAASAWDPISRGESTPDPHPDAKTHAAIAESLYHFLNAPS